MAVPEVTAVIVPIAPLLSAPLPFTVTMPLSVDDHVKL
jgi:hypothetical protein